MPAVWRVMLLVVLCAGFSEGAASAQDADYDGIPDALEAELAARFVPTLRPPSPGGCYVGGPLPLSLEWRPRLIYRARYPTKNGNSYPDVIAITFEVLYDEDCGPKVLGLEIFPGPHRGDNEPFIVFLKVRLQQAGLGLQFAVRHGALARAMLQQGSQARRNPTRPVDPSSRSLDRPPEAQQSHFPELARLRPGTVVRRQRRHQHHRACRHR